MKNRLAFLIPFVLVGLLLFCVGKARAANLQVDLPYGLGSLQLPWQATEVVYGEMKPIKGGLWHQVAGASLPILTIGKLSNGETLIDGEIGAIASIPTSGAVPDAYGAFGHNFAQDIPYLQNYPSAHLSVGTSYSNALQGWCWGGTASYAFGGPDAPSPSARLQTPIPANAMLNLYKVVG